MDNLGADNFKIGSELGKGGSLKHSPVEVADFSTLNLDFESGTHIIPLEVPGAPTIYLTPENHALLRNMMTGPNVKITLHTGKKEIPLSLNALSQTRHGDEPGIQI